VGAILVLVRVLIVIGAITGIDDGHLDAFVGFAILVALDVHIDIDLLIVVIELRTAHRDE